MSIRKPFTAFMFCIAGACTLPGCTEEIGNQPPSPQAQAPQQSPASGSASVSPVGQGGGSALGGAKRAAGNIAQQAEQKSQEVANQADELNE